MTRRMRRRTIRSPAGAGAAIGAASAVILALLLIARVAQDEPGLAIGATALLLALAASIAARWWRLRTSHRARSNE